MINNWKQPSILLTAVGISWLGSFIYLVAINILIYDMTGSATAVALLWVIGPATNMLTKFWTGSFIDYRSKRKIMIVTDIIRGVLVFFIPFLPNVGFIFLFLIFLSVANAFFAPSSITYTTQLIPKQMRKRYNSIQSLTNSGAFIVGPAIGGILILIGSVDNAIIINAVSFLISAVLLYFLPEMERFDTDKAPRLSLDHIKEDWSIVIKFMKDKKYVAIVYSTYLATVIVSFAMDTQEVVFTQAVVGLSELNYSLLISITGIGAIVGGLLVSIFSEKLSLRFMIAIGITMQSVGYIIYGFSWSFLSITIGFIILGFFNAFLNAGIMTFYQNNVPTSLMGRVTSVFQLIQSALQIIFVLLVGLVADIIPLRLTIATLAIGMFILAVMFVFILFSSGRTSYFKET